MVSVLQKCYVQKTIQPNYSQLWYYTRLLTDMFAPDGTSQALGCSFEVIRKFTCRRNCLHRICLQILQMCPALNTNEIQIPRDERHSLVKRHKSTPNSVKYEVI